MHLRDGWIRLERIISRSPDPDTVFADTGNHRVVKQATQTLDESNGPSTAQRDNWSIVLLNRLTIVLSNF
jgi:hypothetical protein